MEKQTTGIYLSGHPLDEQGELVKQVGATPIGQVLAAFAPEEEEGMGRAESDLRDGMYITLAGIVSAVKLKTTKNNTTMAYVTLEDRSGSMELLVFQKAMDSAGLLWRTTPWWCMAAFPPGKMKRPSWCVTGALSSPPRVRRNGRIKTEIVDGEMPPVGPLHGLRSGRRRKGQKRSPPAPGCISASVEKTPRYWNRPRPFCAKALVRRRWSSFTVIPASGSWPGRSFGSHRGRN